MITIRLTKSKASEWHHEGGVYTTGYLFAPDGKLYRNVDLCAYFGDIKTESDFRQKLLSANGTFSVIIQKDQSSLWMAVDRLKYFPLFYRRKNGDLLISDEITDLYDSDEQKKLDEESCLAFRGLGYTLGNKTLLKDVFLIQAGEYIIYDNDKIVRTFYHQYFSKIKNICFDEAKEQLKNILQNIGKRMSEFIDNRQVLLSLSGGLDSRLISYLLKKEGMKNVLCFTYGKKEANPEWKRSHAVAEKLGFQWLFVDYTLINDLEYSKRKHFIDYYLYAAQYYTKFSVTQYFAADYLTNEMKIPVDSVYLPGHGGDFFSGSHLRPYMQNYRTISTIAEDLQISNFHSNSLVELTRKEKNVIKKLIQKELTNISPLFQNVENWDLKERQAKYIFTSNKLWEHRGIGSYMPLCDTELMDFFVSLPFEYRINQKLYKAVLYELFAEFDINFSNDIRKSETDVIQQIKMLIKRMFPDLRKNQDVFLYDYFDFKRFSQPILKELEEADEKRKILSFNGIFSEWYLLQLKKLSTIASHRAEE